MTGSHSLATHKKLYQLVPEIIQENTDSESILDAQFPHVAQTILSMWGSSECVDYLESLTEYDVQLDRPERSGFPFPAVVEINTVLEAHIAAFPEFQGVIGQRGSNIWQYD
jgi:hypothetical protein